MAAPARYQCHAQHKVHDKGQCIGQCADVLVAEHEGKRIGFGDVAADAIRVKPPSVTQLREPGSGRLVGEALPRLDLPAKSDGSFRFASDIRLPRMIHASVRIAPPAGRLTGFSRDAARQQHGLIDLVVREGWLAALGQTWWAADNALARGAPRFSGTDSRDINLRLAEQLESGDTDRLFERGDYSSVTKGSTPLAATYSIAPTPHHSLQAPAAVARFTGNRLEVWAATQIPDLARSVAAKAGGVAEDQVALYPMPVGDGSGSAFQLDVIGIVVELAKHAGRPVSLVFPPATAQNQDAVRSPMLARMSALPSPEGTLAAWGGRFVGAPGLSAELALAQGTKRPPFRPGLAPPYGIPAIRIDSIDAGLPIHTGYMRGGDEAMIAFATESFIDEMARVAGAEPLAFRMGMPGRSSSQTCATLVSPAAARMISPICWRTVLAPRARSAMRCGSVIFASSIFTHRL